MADERERVGRCGDGVVTRSPLECHQKKKQRLFGGIAMTAGRQHKKEELCGQLHSLRPAIACVRVRNRANAVKSSKLASPMPSTAAAYRVLRNAGNRDN